VSLCDPAGGAGEIARLAEPPLYAADEIRAALAWTRRAAERELGFAETLVLRMPAVFAALDAGRIDRGKAWIFAESCAELTAEHVEVICQRLLPLADRLTIGELAARIRKIAIALDPEWAARRYASAVRERDVVGYLNEDGTATVTGTCPLMLLPGRNSAGATVTGGSLETHPEARTGSRYGWDCLPAQVGPSSWRDPRLGANHRRSGSHHGHRAARRAMVFRHHGRHRTAGVRGYYPAPASTQCHRIRAVSRWGR
jgi:Domain of unknown function (DUF222)